MNGNILKDLNKRQELAATTTEGTVRVVAGAGSGKTRVLAHRYAFLVNELGISPANILCMTFTNKAAQEMKHRISTMVERGNVNDFICTIHGFCVKFLRKEIYRLGYPKSFTIIDEEDAKQLAAMAMADFGIDRRKTTAERFLKSVAGVKGYDPAAYIQRMLPGAPYEATDAVGRYMSLQLKQYCLDFDDLLYFTVFILDRFPDARAYWTDTLNYIMVDEVQDCTGDDWKLLRILAEKHGNLFVVGDPDQCIYEWRGANPKLFVNFKAATDIILNENYRSTPDILDIANSVIAQNKNRVPKDLFTKRLNERQAVYHHCRTEKEEAEFVASTIISELNEGASLRDFAVLYRSSYVSRRLEQALLNNKIPYSVWGGVRFFERKEIKDAMAYLRLVASSDDLSFTRVINVPARKFGKAAMQQLRELAESTGESLYDTLLNNLDTFSARRPAIREFASLIEECRLLKNDLPVSELSDMLMRRSGLTDLYRTDTEEERLENLSELINSMREYEESRDAFEEATLEAYLQDMALYTNADTRSDGERVRLMTIHKSKGLEFPCVFVVGLTEGLFPSHRTIRERRIDGEEEERRLMYVAVTRACSMLYLSESEGFINDSGALKYPSRYLSEIPGGLLIIEGNPDKSLFEGTRKMIAALNSEAGESSEAPWSAGTRVSHKVFGEGEIVSYDAANHSYRVRFATSERNLLPHVLTLL